jgi:protein gp37
MGENTGIEWAHHTLNSWIGCTKLGPGCDHCYAETWDKQGEVVRWGPHAVRTRTKENTRNQALRWNRATEKAGVRHRVFSASLSDVFDNHGSIEDEWRKDLGDLILATPHLDWLLLTKRIQNAKKMLSVMFPDGVPKHVWLGATIVNQQEANRDIPILLRTKRDLGISIAFLSMEPLLGPVNLDQFTPRVDWVIVGGESGSMARPMQIDWVRDLRDQCERTGTPFLFKQWGEWFPYCEIDADGLENSVMMGEKPGVWHAWEDGRGFSVRLGKKKAGRLLDGRSRDGVPVPCIPKTESS